MKGAPPSAVRDPEGLSCGESFSGGGDGGLAMLTPVGADGAFTMLLLLALLLPLPLEANMVLRRTSAGLLPLAGLLTLTVALEDSVVLSVRASALRETFISEVEPPELLGVRRRPKARPRELEPFLLLRPLSLGGEEQCQEKSCVASRTTMCLVTKPGQMSPGEASCSKPRTVSNVGRME
jgi:hypothetical protein